MKKILILTNNDVGIYNFRLELIERFLSEGHKVIICSPYGEKIDLLTKIGCEFVNIELSRHGTNPFKELKLLRQYKKLIKQLRPDVVLTYTIKPNVYGGLASRKLKVPFIANITGLGDAVENGGLLQKITLFLYKIGV